MKRIMKTLLYGEPSECQAAGALMGLLKPIADCDQKWLCVSTLEELGAALVDWEPTLAIVIENGAAGMEGVYLSRTRRPNLPVFWFSDDHDFGMQSYRLNCAYFSTKPVTSEKMLKGLQRCAHIGIHYEVG